MKTSVNIKMDVEDRDAAVKREREGGHRNERETESKDVLH